VADGLDIPFKQGEVLAKNEFWTFNPEEMLEKKRFWNYAQAALNRLSAEHCEIFVLIKLEGRSYEDAAAILEIPINTVKSRLNRAREALANECAPLFKGQS
jgi:RNA polymerase sigma-70 factor (ECF subfamily)